MNQNIEANKQLVRDHYEQLVNQKNVAAAEQQLSADFIDHNSPPGTPPGPTAARKAMHRLYAGLPDVRVTLEDVVAEGDRVAVRATWRGTFQGPLFGLAPTGGPVTITGMVFWRIAGGKIVERWASVDINALKTTGSRPGLQGIMETALYTDDLAAAEHFYTNVLGLKKIFTVPGRQLVFRNEQSILLIFDHRQAATERVVINGGVIPFHGATGAGHMAFKVNAGDMDLWREQLRSAGVAIESEITWPNDARSLYFRDPAGNVLELVTAGMWTAMEDRRN